jgi:hypothetical protein
VEGRSTFCRPADASTNDSVVTMPSSAHTLPGEANSPGRSHASLPHHALLTDEPADLAQQRAHPPPREPVPLEPAALRCFRDVIAAELRGEPP